jgi:hypothetical protein
MHILRLGAETSQRGRAAIPFSCAFMAKSRVGGLEGWGVRGASRTEGSGLGRSLNSGVSESGMALYKKYIGPSLGVARLRVRLRFLRMTRGR